VRGAGALGRLLQHSRADDAVCQRGRAGSVTGAGWGPSLKFRLGTSRADWRLRGAGCWRFALSWR